MFNTIIKLKMKIGEKKLKIISVNIQKGGCGKTTTVQVLAEMLSKDYGKKVLCIDSDAQCNLTNASAINIMECQDHNFYTLLDGKSKLEQCIVHSKYYDLIPASIDLSTADVDFGQISRDRYLLNQLNKTDYDFVLIDTPPALGYLNLLSLSISTHVLIPTECSYFSLMGLDQLFDTIMRVKQIANEDLQILGILMIKYNARANLNNAVYEGLKQMAEEMNTKVFETKIRETIKVREAQSQFEPVTDWANDSSAVVDYKEFVKELLEVL